MPDDIDNALRRLQLPNAIELVGERLSSRATSSTRGLDMSIDRLLRPCLHAALLTLVACGPDDGRTGADGSEFGGPEPCTPGQQQACACPGGRPDGVQVCNDAGDRF